MWVYIHIIHHIPRLEQRKLARVTFRAPETATIGIKTGEYGPYDDNRRSMSLI